LHLGQWEASLGQKSNGERGKIWTVELAIEEEISSNLVRWAYVRVQSSRSLHVVNFKSATKAADTTRTNIFSLGPLAVEPPLTGELPFELRNVSELVQGDGREKDGILV